MKSEVNPKHREAIDSLNRRREELANAKADLLISKQDSRISEETGKILEGIGRTFTLAIWWFRKQGRADVVEGPLWPGIRSQLREAYLSAANQLQHEQPHGEALADIIFNEIIEENLWYTVEAEKERLQREKL